MSIAKIRDGDTKNFLVSMIDSIDDEQRVRLFNQYRNQSEIVISWNSIKNCASIDGIGKQIQSIIDRNDCIGNVFYYDSRYGEIVMIPVEVLTEEGV